MVVEYKGASWMLRWFHRCPECGGWLALRVTSSEHHPIIGTQRQYRCRKCDAHIEDWKPSENLKFADAPVQVDQADSGHPNGAMPIETSAQSDNTASHYAGIGMWAWIAVLGLVAAVQAGSYFVVDGGRPLLLGLSAVLSYFVYTHVSEYQLFVRNLIFDAAIKKDGWAYSLVSKARFLKFILFCLAFIVSGSFLLHANQMPLYIWGLVYLDVLILMTLFRLSRRTVASVANPKFFGLFQRKTVFRINIAVLTTLVCAVSFFMPVADTSSLSILQSGQMAWEQAWQSTADPLVGFWSGMIAAFDAMMWNIMQQLSHFDFNALQKFFGWMVFLMIQAVYLWVIQSAMLGVLAIHQKSGSLLDRMLGESRTAKLGWGVFYSLVIIWLIFGLTLGTQQQVQLQIESMNFIEAPAPEKITIDPCKDAAQNDMAAVNQTMDQHIAEKKRRYTSVIDPYIDAQVDQAFAHAVSGVDAYLDWYFTVVGEWQRLTTVVVGDIGTLMKDKMAQLILNDSGFKDAIQAAQSNVSSHVAEQFTQATQSMIAIARQQVEIHPCSTSQQIDVVLPSLSHDMKRLALTISTTAAAGIAIAKTAGAAITTKLAATASAKIAAKVLAKAAAKTAAKAAGSMAGAGAGALAGLSCGPFAPACSVALAVVGFVGVDALFMDGDELLNRNQMRKEMIQALMAQRDQVKAQQKTNYHKAGDVFFTKVSNKAHAYFVPAKDGVLSPWKGKGGIL